MCSQAFIQHIFINAADEFDMKYIDQSFYITQWAPIAFTFSHKNYSMFSDSKKRNYFMNKKFNNPAFFIHKYNLDIFVAFIEGAFGRKPTPESKFIKYNF